MVQVLLHTTCPLHVCTKSLDTLCNLAFNLLNAIFSAPGAVVQMGNVVCNKFKVE